MAIKRKVIGEEGCLYRFYKIVLGWDYIRLLNETQNLELQHVKNTYKDVDDYLATFEPLLFEEVKAHILQTKDQKQKQEWMMGITVECQETADGFHIVELFVGEDWGMGSVSQNDLLLLSRDKFGLDDTRPTTYAFALIEHRLPDNKLRLRMHLDGEIKRVRTNEATTSESLLNVRSRIMKQKISWHVMKICSLSTIAREYVALLSISSLPYKDLILKAADDDSIHTSSEQAWKISKPLMDYIQANHNSTQLEAIRAGLSRRKFVLIQGPPGTGKTQTILGLLSAILHATPARIHTTKGKISEIKRVHIGDKKKQWAKASPWLTTGINPRDAKMPKDGDDGFFPTTGNDLKPEVVSSSRKYRVRVLVCAPSNSALDEIVSRLLSTGIRDENDRAYTPKIVRIGLKAHHSVQSVSMDYLVEQKLASQTAEQGGGTTRDRDIIRASIMDESAIVFSTLSFSGSSSVFSCNFDVVIIDEAAQAVEPATLVPLASGCKQVFLVGDPIQLPATVISTVAENFGYSTSLFKRFQTAGYPVQMLKTQYRMHPEIRSFPSKEFYNGELEDGLDVKDRTKRLWHKYRCFGPFCFFDIQDQHQHQGGKSSEKNNGGSSSRENIDEVDFVLLMYHKLVRTYPQLKSSSRLAIISPYRSQVELFRTIFKEMFGVDSEKLVDINTVDGFQGREKDVVIISCVRTIKERGIGFVADFRRMNVAITRARASVLVVGSANALRKEQHWESLISSAEDRNCLFKVLKPYNDFFSDDNLALMAAEEDVAVPDGLGPDDIMDPDALGYDLPIQPPPDDDDDYGDAAADDGVMDDD